MVNLIFSTLFSSRYLGRCVTHILWGNVYWLWWQVVYQPMSVIVTVFNKADVKNPLEGFGVLIPRKEQANGFFTLGMCLHILDVIQIGV